MPFARLLCVGCFFDNLYHFTHSFKNDPSRFRCILICFTSHRLVAPWALRCLAAHHQKQATDQPAAPQCHAGNSMYKLITVHQNWTCVHSKSCPFCSRQGSQVPMQQLQQQQPFVHTRKMQQLPTYYSSRYSNIECYVTCATARNTCSAFCLAALTIPPMRAL